MKYCSLTLSNNPCKRVIFLTQVKNRLCLIIINCRITGNFCDFGLKRRHLIFTDFFSADLIHIYFFGKFSKVTASEYTFGSFNIFWLTIFVIVFAICFVDRKYEVNSWIDVGMLFDSSEIYIFKEEFSYFSIHFVCVYIFFKEFELEAIIFISFSIM
jgi:hypothetical protein